jgi:hypothetical protein
VIIRPRGGHDGKYSFVQAVDPWLLDPDGNISVVDRPLYRAQRMLYPVLAGGMGLFSPRIIVWAMLIVNILAMGVGTWAVAELALDMGGSAWWGLSFLANPGLMGELLIDGSGVVAAAAAFGAVLMIGRGDSRVALALITCAALARESMLVVAFGTAIWAWTRGGRRLAVRIASIPTLAVAVWAVYIRLQAGIEEGFSQIIGIGLPFVGLLETFEYRSLDVLHVVGRFGVLLLFVLYLRQAWRHRSLALSWAFVGLVPLGLIATREVWASYWDFTRAIAPLITALLLLFFVADRRDVNRPQVPSVVS